MRKIVCRGAFVGHLMDMVWYSEGKVNTGSVLWNKEVNMVKKKRTARMLITRVIVTILAMAMTVGMAPYPGRTAYAESNDGYEDNGDEGDLDDDFGNGDDSDDDSDVDPNATQYEWIENEDGTWTLIKTYYEDGQKTGSKEETRSQDGSQTVTVNKDENGNVYETEIETITYNDEGDAVKYETVTKDENDKVVMESVVERHEDGTETETETYYDEDGVKTGSTEITTDEMGTPVKTVSKDADGNVCETVVKSVEVESDDTSFTSVTTEVTYDGDGNVTRKTVETVAMGENYFESSSLTEDGDGNVLENKTLSATRDEDGNISRVEKQLDGDGNVIQYEETRGDSEGNVTGTTSAYYMTDADGNQVYYTREADGEDNTISSYESTKDENGTLIREEETVYDEDGAHTVTVTDYDENGNKTGSTENTYDESGFSTKSVTKDAEGKITESSTTERDEDGNFVTTSVTYDSDGKVSETSVITMSPDLRDVTVVTMDSDGKVTETYSGHATTDEDGNIIRTITQMDGEGNVLSYEQTVLDENGNETANVSRTYDPEDRLTTEVDTKDVQASEVEVSGLTPELAKALCTAEELGAYEAGAAITFRMEIKGEGKAAVSDDAASVKKAMQDKGITMSGAKYFDVSLYMRVGGIDERQVTETGSRTITVTMEVPAELKNTNTDVIRTFYVVRVHDGAATVLAQGTEDQISFESNQFSTYALAYRDEAKAGDDDDDDDDDDGTADPGNSAANNAAQASNATSPKTGEETHAGMWLLLIGAACILGRKAFLRKI